ncbi:MAG: hypothetical protein OXH42_10670 [Acidimicrobiaceae bacterium]|nr:hypothetical protein [Acidimicrobiaceae bacterium]
MSSRSNSHDRHHPQPPSPNPTEHNQWYPFANRPLPPEVDGQAVNPAAIPVFDAVPLPPRARFVVVGAGVHGLSSAYPTWPCISSARARTRAATWC